MIGIVGLLYRRTRAAPSFKSKVPRGDDWIDGVLRLLMLGSSEKALKNRLEKSLVLRRYVAKSLFYDVISLTERPPV